MATLACAPAIRATADMAAIQATVDMAATRATPDLATMERMANMAMTDTVMPVSARSCRSSRRG